MNHKPGLFGSTRYRTLVKYVLLQIPGLVLILLFLSELERREFVSLETAGLLVLAWMIKDAVMFPIVQSAYGPGPPHGTDALVGRVGTVSATLSPTGRVRIGAEDWAARSAGAEGGGREMAAGTAVRIVAVEGYLMVVAPIAAGTRDHQGSPS